MARSTFLQSLLTVVLVCALVNMSFAKAAPKAKCDFNGNYSFFFSDNGFGKAAGVGYFTAQLDPGTNCRSGAILPGGIINCDVGGAVAEIFESFIEGGSVFLESDGEGTMLVETNSSEGICGTGLNAIELDVSLVLSGKTVLFNSDGEEFAGSGLVPQAGYEVTLTGRADKCFAGQISGCYDLHFWQSGRTGPIFNSSSPQFNLPFTEPFSAVGDCTVCVDGAGAVTGGTCRCNSRFPPKLGGIVETLSEIEGGGYTLGEDCQSSTGYLWFVTSSDEICDVASYMAFDFAVAQQGKELIGACDTDLFILNNDTEINAGAIGCAFEGWLQ
ncbi:MAG TPA: hypothetical protein VMB26_12485 [Candidatus Binataceae bacterium]|nr:hypothetical protein [Candidatus Binataceae bacterium]